MRSVPPSASASFLAGLPAAEIVDVLRGVGAAGGQFRNFSVALGPEVERLTSDEESLVAQLQDSREIIDDLWIEHGLIQAKAS